MKTLLQVEDSVNEIAKFYNLQHERTCVIIYDRGAMDPVACKLTSTLVKVICSNPI